MNGFQALILKDDTVNVTFYYLLWLCRAKALTVLLINNITPRVSLVVVTQIIGFSTVKYSVSLFTVLTVMKAL